MATASNEGRPIILKLIGEPDQLFENGPYPKPFSFNEEVARVFDDMVVRSIPLYRDVTGSAVDWAARHYQDGSLIYDVGCSTGTTLEALCQRMSHGGRKIGVIGIDNSAPMLAQAQVKLERHAQLHDVELKRQDANEVEFSNASVVIINYTLQFIPVAQRLHLLKRVYSGLRPGGVLYLSDKVRSCCPEFQESVTYFYETFKSNRGYSRNEIEKKKEALDNVLIPLSFSEQMDLVARAGFEFYEPVLKWNNFLSIVAMKQREL